MVLKEKQNFQVYPAKQFVVPNDRLSKKLFNMTKEDFQNWINQRKTYNLVEILQHRKFGKILSPVKLSVDDENFIISEPLDQFHCAVLCAVISEFYANNHQTTVPIIYRAITGKVNRGSRSIPSKKQVVDIKNAIHLLMHLQINYNPTELCEKIGYNNGKSTEIVSVLLPCKRLELTTINGQDADVIELLGESPLLTSAKMKNNQILTYATELLDVPNMNNSRMNIGLKHYTMRRIQEILLHRQLQTIITFEDLFYKSQIENASFKTKKDARDVVVTFFEHLKNKRVVKSFEIKKQRNAFHSIEFVPIRKRERQLIIDVYD